MAYGVSEIERATSLLEMLNAGKFALLAEFLNVSHDGDRVRNITARVRENKEVPDAYLRGLTGPLTRLAGDYHCSHPDIDDMADIALKAGGAAARIVGAGLGGSLMALVELDAVDRVVQAMQKEYYGPKKIECVPIVALPVQGACLI
jgi:galactokinase